MLTTFLKRSSQKDHDVLVKQVVVELLRLNSFSEICADLTGHSQPNRIYWETTGEGHIPDVTAKGEHFCIFEVETYDSIEESHTSDQWKLFAAFANQHNAVFYVVVPVGYKKQATQRLTALGITAKVLEM